jgi:hypothetical protein
MDLRVLYGILPPMNWPVQATSDPLSGSVEITDPNPKNRPSPSSGDSAMDWLCAWCMNRVASEKDRFAPEGKSEFAFTNPEGIRFFILTFARTNGCRQAGMPTFEHTWFPGHAWSYCVCARCDMHLGWYYDGPVGFAGLIRNRIVRATLILN